MGHPKIDNETPFAFEPLFAADEAGRPIVVAVIKATFRFDGHGDVWLADQQAPVSLAGQPWTEAAVSSYRYEPEVAFVKPSTDVALIGHAHPPFAGATQVEVGIKIGSLRKLANVLGNRFWLWTSGGVRMSRTEPLEPTPLIWEHAFGGRDDVHSTPERPLFESRNPVGTGFGTPLLKQGDVLRLPNIEDATEPISEYGAVVTPCGFGFISPNWQPRAAFAGTYDDEWSETTKPLLPVDFDRRFFNAGAPGLVAPGYLRGDEQVVLLNASVVPRVEFRLPALPPPACRVVLKGKPDAEISTNLDTVIVNADEQILTLLWRGFSPISSGPHDVGAINVRANPAP